jgi:hypothetical protein
MYVQTGAQNKDEDRTKRSGRSTPTPTHGPERLGFAGHGVLELAYRATEEASRTSDPLGLAKVLSVASKAPPPVPGRFFATALPSLRPGRLERRWAAGWV